MHDGHLVLQRRLLRELGIELHVRLGVVVDQLDLPSEQAAGRVGLLDRERQRIDHRLAVDVEPAGEIVDARHVDRIVRPAPHAGGAARKFLRLAAALLGSRGGRLQELSARIDIAVFLLVCRKSASDQKSDPSIRVAFAYADRRLCLRILIQLPFATGLDRRSKAHQGRFFEMATDQHQTDRQTIDAATWHGEGGMA